MSRKSEEAYDDVMNFINENVIDLKCGKFTTDFEVAMRNALHKICPTATLIACWFHFNQAVKRYASQIPGFSAFLKGNDEANKIFKQCRW